jgi:hypothetical protein
MASARRLLEGGAGDPIPAELSIPLGAGPDPEATSVLSRLLAEVPALLDELSAARRRAAEELAELRLRRKALRSYRSRA